MDIGAPKFPLYIYLDVAVLNFGVCGIGFN